MARMFGPDRWPAVRRELERKRGANSSVFRRNRCCGFAHDGPEYAKAEVTQA